jgi:archaellum biogenesis ATPase FlaH
MNTVILKRIAQGEIITEADFANANGTAELARRMYQAKQQGQNDHQLGVILAEAKLTATQIQAIFGIGATPTTKPATPSSNTPTEPRRLLTITGADLYDKQYQPRQFVLDGLIQRGDFVLLAGRPKSGKSWLVLQLVQSLDTGDDFLGRKTTASKCLYLALEDGQRRVHERLHIRKWKPSNAALSFDCLPFDDERGEAGAGLEQLFGTISEQGFEVVVIDTLRKALSGKSDESDNATMGAILYRIAEFAHNSGVTIILTHHTTKAAADDPFNTIRGAGAIRGAYDVGLVLQREKDEKEAQLHIESRDIDTDGMTIKFDKAQGWIYEGDSNALEKIRAGRKAIQALREMGEMGEKFTTEEIATHLSISPQAARKQLLSAHEKGYLKRGTGEPKKAGGKRPDVWSL